jgi:protein-S-isoprenylcysteine O-methyltransferase Ste14
MALIHSFESSGNSLFRHRGQIPVLLFLVAIPAIYFTDYNEMGMTWLTGCKVAGVLLSVLGFLVRCYAIGTTPKGTSGRNTEEQVAEQLNQTGIYATVRHPLYLGNYFMWIGIVLYTGNLWFVLAVSLAYWLYYERIMFAEERFLERKFGQPYLDWSLKTPAFIPDFSRFTPSMVPFSIKSVLRREYAGVLNTVIGFVFVELLQRSFAEGTFAINRTSLIVLGVAVAVTLLLRTLKHSTRLLQEEGRS